MNNVKWVLNKDVNILGGGNGTNKSFLLKKIYDSFVDERDTFAGNCYFRSISVYNNKFYAVIDSAFSDYKLPIEYINTFDCELPSIEELSNIKSNGNQKIKTYLDFDLNKIILNYFDYNENLAYYHNNPNYSIIEQENFLKPLNTFEKIISKCLSETNKKLCGNGEIHKFLLNNEEISVYNLSAGEKALLLILTKVLLLDNKNSIMILDNPENCLHIDWQKELISWIREINPNVQLIISTHSPAIIMNGWLDKVTNIEDLPTAGFMTIN